jgi:formamidopyrimidine-DNA glycosylase
MPELAEVDYFRKRWNPGLKQRIEAVEIHGQKRLFRGIDAKQFSSLRRRAKLKVVRGLEFISA